MSNELRKLIINKYNQGINLATISQDLEIKFRTVQSVVRTYLKSGIINSSHSNSGRAKKVNQEVILKIRELIDDNVSITLNQIKKIILQQNNISISKSSIARLISDFSYSYKRLSLVPEARNASHNIQLRKTYASTFLLTNLNNYIFIDETGISFSMRNAYGRSIKGSTPRKIVRSIRSQNVSICSAISRKELILFETVIAAYNTEKFKGFIINLIETLRRKNMKNCSLIMDNCSIHKAQEIRSIIEDAGHVLIFIPPYSPQLNPIEEMFSKWKALIKSFNSNNMNELFHAITQAHLNITEQDCNGFFDHMLVYISKALQEEPF